MSTLKSRTGRLVVAVLAGLADGARDGWTGICLDALVAPERRTGARQPSARRPGRMTVVASDLGDAQVNGASEPVVVTAKLPPGLVAIVDQRPGGAHWRR